MPGQRLMGYKGRTQYPYAIPLQWHVLRHGNYSPSFASRGTELPFNVAVEIEGMRKGWHLILPKSSKRQSGIELRAWPVFRSSLPYRSFLYWHGFCTQLTTSSCQIQAINYSRLECLK